MKNVVQDVKGRTCTRCGRNWQECRCSFNASSNTRLPPLTRSAAMRIVRWHAQHGTIKSAVCDHEFFHAVQTICP